MQLNTVVPSIYTHEGGKAKRIKPEQELRRSVMACMLWEKTFYEDGKEIADRITSLIPKVDPRVVASIAVEARTKMKLRHCPLLIVREMARLASHRALVAATLEEVIQRPDELTEFLAIYWKDGKTPLSHGVKKGLAKAFTKFNAYQLGKYNRDNAIKLRDVLFMVHAKPKNDEQAQTWKWLVDGTLPVPDTWEVALSGGADKKETFTRLIAEKKLGALAYLRNLRNMLESGVELSTVRAGLKEMNTERVLPFRFIAAARHAVRLESELEEAMFKCIAGAEKLKGETTLLIDVSGSMDSKISDKSDMDRLDAACGLAMLLREIGNTRIFTFSERLVEVPNRRGFALRDAIVKSQPHGGTYLGQALNATPGEYDRLIVLTDEQSADRVPNPKVPHAYMINIAAYKNGVGYGPWLHLDGWSEAIVDYLREFETEGEKRKRPRRNESASQNSKY